MTEIKWPGHCEKPAHPEIGENGSCKEAVYFALVARDGSSPMMFLCRKHALEFMAMVSLENQKDILMSGLGKMTVGR